jgi:hypothetical protein
MAILGQDVLATQQSQSDGVQILTQSSDHKYQVAVGKLRSYLKLIEDDDVKYQSLLDYLDKKTMDKVAQIRAVAKQEHGNPAIDVNASTLGFQKCSGVPRQEYSMR